MRFQFTDPLCFGLNKHIREIRNLASGCHAAMLVGRSAEGAEMSELEMPEWPAEGLYGIQATGSGAYGDALSKIAKNPGDTTNLTFLRVVLLPDDNNRYDPNAVAVLHMADGSSPELLGHLSRAHAIDYRARLKTLGFESMASVCNAVLSGGLQTNDRSYSYVLELDLDLSISPTKGAIVAMGEPKREASNPTFEKDRQGSYRFRCWLTGGLDGHHPKNRTKAWTTPDWDTVNYYLQNAQGIGLGAKLISVPKEEHRRAFGDGFASAVVEGIDGRWVTLRLDQATE